MGTSNAGVQISFGSFSGSRPCSVALNNASGSNCIYTGVGKNATNDICPTFPQAFAETLITLATPQAGTYWFGDTLASTDAITRLDFYTNKKYTSTSALSVGGNYIAIGKYGSTDIGTALNDVRAYWNGDHDIRIPVDDSTAIQISSGSLSKSGTFAAMNSTLYRASVNPAKNFSNPFSSAPKVFISPSMKCRKWGDDTTFSHPYWFGGVTADSTRITQLDAYTNAGIGSTTIYGRYIAIGLCANNVSGWTQVPVSLTKGGNSGYVLRFGNAEGMQLAFGDVYYNDRKIQKQLNDVASANIYTAYKEAPAYDDNEPMYFAKAFSESPSTVVMTAMACRHNDANGKAVFDHPYWFGDAASDAVCIMNLDLYTNNKYTTDQEVYAKYLAAGTYSAQSDWARDFILNALSYKNMSDVSGTEIGNYFLTRYHSLFGGETKLDTGWCSEFASVVLHDGKNDTNKVYPHSTYVRAFVSKLIETNSFYMAVDDNTSFVPAKMDNTGDYHFGGTSDSGNDLSFTCAIDSDYSGNGFQPAVGDLIFFNESNSCHTGIVINVNGSYVYTVEGNISKEGETIKRVLHKRRKLTGTDHKKLVGIGRVYNYA